MKINTGVVFITNLEKQAPKTFFVKAKVVEAEGKGIMKNQVRTYL